MARSSVRLSLIAALCSLSAFGACGGDEFAAGDEAASVGGSGGSGGSQSAGSGGSQSAGSGGQGGPGGASGQAGQAGQGAQGGASGQGGAAGQGASSGQSGQAGGSGEGGSAGSGGSSGQGPGGSAGSAGSAGEGGSAGSGGSSGQGPGGSGGSSGQGGGGSGGSSGQGPGGTGPGGTGPGGTGGSGPGGSGPGGSGPGGGGSGGGVILCGDQICSSPVEACDNCPQDCGSCGPKCGNGACEPGESCTSCPGDCGACPGSCGNNVCDAGETCSSCPGDCGACGPAAKACQDYADAACSRWDVCAPYLMSTQFGSVSACSARLSARCQAEFSLGGVSLKAPAVLSDCVGKALSASCETMVSPSIYDVCGSVFGGQLQLNNGCQSHAQCASGFCAITSSGCGLCSPPPQHGVTTCPQSRDCGAGMVCGADNLCYQRGVLEKTCGNAPCLPSLECNFDAHQCAQPLGLGQGCDPGNDLCSKAKGLFCDSNANSVCAVIPLSGQGGVCGGTSDNVCIGGTHCGFNDTFSCVPNAADGAPCSQQNPCLPYASCIAYGSPDTTCQMPQPNKLCASTVGVGGG